MVWKSFFVTDVGFLLDLKTPSLLIHTTESLQCWFIQWAGGFHPASCRSDGFTSAWNIYWKPKEFSACHYTSSPRPTCTPVNAVLMQIRPGESTYYKQLTFVLIYWIVSATESLKPDPLTSSFLSLLTLTGQAWQVELQQSSLIMWNKSICLEIVGRLQTAGDALILLLWCDDVTRSPPLDERIHSIWICGLCLMCRWRFCRFHIQPSGVTERSADVETQLHFQCRVFLFQ